MSKIIIITGDLATGKSTFSQVLSKRYKTEVYNKDLIKEMLADSIGFSNREENLKLSRAAVDLMIMTFEQHAKNNVDIILEANFHKDELERIYKIANDNSTEILTLVLEADIDILFARFKNRIECENRHPAHQSAGLNSEEAFSEYILNSRKDLIMDDYIKLDANSFAYQSDKHLLDKIDCFMRVR